MYKGGGGGGVANVGRRLVSGEGCGRLVREVTGW